MLPIAIVVAVAVLGVGAGMAWRSRARAKVLREDVLKRFLEERLSGREPTLQGLAGILGVRLARLRRCLGALAARGLVASDGASLRLTAGGRAAASTLLRSHRVLETYLSERGGRPLPVLHRLADRLEHRTSPERIDAMDRSLGHPVRDPHGDLIPGRSRWLEGRPWVALAVCPPGSLVRVLHVEDEPDAVFQELLAAGVVPGAELEVLANDEGGVRLTVAGVGERRMDAFASAMVDVVPGGVGAAELRGMLRLCELELGRSGRVVMLTAELRPEARRRLLDLGFTPGAEVRPVLANALGGDPTAYLIRQSRIALRREQARCILVVRDAGARQSSAEAA